MSLESSHPGTDYIRLLHFNKTPSNYILIRARLANLGGWIQAKFSRGRTWTLLCLPLQPTNLPKMLLLVDREPWGIPWWQSAKSKGQSVGTAIFNMWSLFLKDIFQAMEWNRFHRPAIHDAFRFHMSQLSAFDLFSLPVLLWAFVCMCERLECRFKYTCFNVLNKLIAMLKGRFTISNPPHFSGYLWRDVFYLKHFLIPHSSFSW